MSEEGNCNTSLSPEQFNGQLASPVTPPPHMMTPINIDELSPEQLEEKQDQLLSLVPESEAVGNITLRNQLGSEWSEGLYWGIRNRLIERGLLRKGGGLGGSVRRIPAEPTGAIGTDNSGIFTSALVLAGEAQAPFTPDYSKEANLYAPMATVIRNQWSKEQGFDNYLVEMTAKQGSKPTGKWTRPDITAVGYKTFPFVPGRFLEVISFEIKPTATADVAAVYEALAHRRATTRSYVIVHMPKAEKESYSQVIDAIYDECRKFGVGFILAGDPADFSTWDPQLDAERVEPDPNRLNQFIAEQTSAELKEQIVRWFK